MKTQLLFIVTLFAFNLATAQTDTSALYFKYPIVPPFTITKVPDSTKFAKADLIKNKAVLIMVFSPDCDHCKHEIKEITQHIELFKDMQIVLASSLDFRLIKTFYETYKIADFPTITMCRDNSYFLGDFFKVKFFPAIFLYDKKGNFVKTFGGSVPIQKIVDALKG